MGLVVGGVQETRETVTRAATTALTENTLVELSNSAADVSLFTGIANTVVHCRATGAGKLVHSASLDILQGAADITTAAGDTFDVEFITTSTCRVKNYQRNAAPTFSCMAFANANGIGTIGTPMTLRSAGNVTSVTKLATGSFRILFSIAMPDANYTIQANAGMLSAGSAKHVYAPYGATVPTVNGFDLLVTDGVTTADPDVLSIAVFR